MSGEIKIELGKQYSVSAYWKKSLLEAETWVNGDKEIVCEVVWRNGTFIITPESQDEVDILQENQGECEDSLIDIDIFENWEMDSCFDGCSEDLYYQGAHEWTEDEEQYIEEQREEEFLSTVMEEQGFDSDGCEYSIQGGLDIEEFKGYGNN
jgi:hypothetical protein